MSPWSSVGALLGGGGGGKPNHLCSHTISEPRVKYVGHRQEWGFTGHRLFCYWKLFLTPSPFIPYTPCENRPPEPGRHRFTDVLNIHAPHLWPQIIYQGKLDLVWEVEEKGGEEKGEQEACREMRHIITLSTPISAASCGAGSLLLSTEHELFSVMAVLCVGNKACPPMHDVVCPHSLDIG